MPRPNVMDESALDEHTHTHGHTVGAEVKKLFLEMQANIKQLQEMHDYAAGNDFNETAKYLKKVLEAFEGLKRKYGSAEILNEIKKAAHINQPLKAAKQALKDAKEGMQEHIEEKELFIRWLMTTPHQQAYENVNTFISPQRNKFEIFIDSVEQFEQAHKKDSAKNASRFFQSKAPVDQDSKQDVAVKPAHKLK